MVGNPRDDLLLLSRWLPRRGRRKAEGGEERKRARTHSLSILTFGHVSSASLLRKGKLSTSALRLPISYFTAQLPRDSCIRASC